ncbi:MAG: 16S rRNA (uracil(1498)-N(3))-methyltransferase, partial [Acidobacteria bacterium]|nr:16S rRNA (uracil(1498)-N(3))-methyltransferase [Acidobacteriota bacterium]
LRDVLRLRVGDEASVFDGLGREFLTTVEKISKKDSVLAVAGEIEPASSESPLDITLAAAILPGEKYEITVQKAVELGVQTLQPLYTKRCEVKPGGSGRRLERWHKIASESAKPSGRARLMKIDEPVDIGEFFKSVGVANEERSLVFFSERGGRGFEEITRGKKITAVFGPKGGWDDAELDGAKTAGFTIVTFGGRIMRAETAAIAMTAILQHRFGDLS